MHPGCAQQDRDQRQRNRAGRNAQDQRQTASDFGKDRQIGEKAGQAEAFEIANGAGDRKMKTFISPWAMNRAPLETRSSVAA